MGESVGRQNTLGTRPALLLTLFTRRFFSYAMVALATSCIAFYAIHGILVRAGHPAVPLDDAFIHFQYAKRLAAGHFFSYVDGEGYSSGATSLVWPLLLAPLHLLGLRNLSIIWGAWFFGFLALGALAIETYRLSEPLAGRAASAGAGAMVFCFGGYVWCAASGMEVVPFAFILAFGLRKCIEWGEAPPEERTPRRLRTLLALALLAPLVRPEGALVSTMVFAVLIAFVPFYPSTADAGPGGRWLVARSPAWVALIGPLLLPLMNLAFTGHAVSSTAVVKWLPGNPYYGHGAALASSVADNVRVFADTLIDGREWSAIYLPTGSRPFAIAALVAIPVAGWLERRPLRAGLVLAMAIAILIPCTYFTFLWNRLRYLWPFAFAWFVGLASLSRCMAELLVSVGLRWRIVGGVFSGVFAAALASHLGWTFDDLSASASAIDRQQVAMARWAAVNLEPGARIGVNDTGAIGYLSGRKTFDVVGLTTPGEATYWVAGAGSRFEHYERLLRESPARLPTHFIVYRHWMACDAVLDEELHEETVIDQTILGGTTMTAYRARYDLLGSGDRPRLAMNSDPVDELDVADLDSEALHDYQVLPARDADDQALVHDIGESTIADGTRVHRTIDRFVLHAPGGGSAPALLIARLLAEAPADLELRVGGVIAASLTVWPGGWTEAKVEIPQHLVAESMTVSLAARDGGHFGSAHYWLYRH